jgi:hypothetical protein
MTESKKPQRFRAEALCESQYRPVLSAYALSRTLAGRAFAPKSTPLRAKVPVCADIVIITNKLSLVSTIGTLPAVEGPESADQERYTSSDLGRAGDLQSVPGGYPPPCSFSLRFAHHRLSRSATTINTPVALMKKVGSIIAVHSTYRLFWPASN